MEHRWTSPVSGLSAHHSCPSAGVGAVRHSLMPGVAAGSLRSRVCRRRRWWRGLRGLLVARLAIPPSPLAMRLTLGVPRRAVPPVPPASRRSTVAPGDHMAVPDGSADGCGGPSAVLTLTAPACRCCQAAGAAAVCPCCQPGGAGGPHRPLAGMPTVPAVSAALPVRRPLSRARPRLDRWRRPNCWVPVWVMTPPPSSRSCARGVQLRAQSGIDVLLSRAGRAEMARIRN